MNEYIYHVNGLLDGYLEAIVHWLYSVRKNNELEETCNEGWVEKVRRPQKVYEQQ